MIHVRSYHALLLTAIGLLLAACSQTTAEPPFDLHAATEPIPALLTQAIGVHGRLSDGLTTQALPDLHLVTLTSVDLHGQPFTNITFLAPVPLDDPWHAASRLTGDEWNDGNDTSAYGTVLTGASTSRDVLIGSHSGVDLLLRLHRTALALGGPNELEEIVALNAHTFTVRDRTGTLWSTDEHVPLSDEAVAAATLRYDEMYALNNTPEFLESQKRQWDELLEQAEAQQQMHGYTLEAFATPGGGLSTLALHAAMQHAGASTDLESQRVTYNRRSCFLFVCWHTQRGEIDPASQAPQGGGLQRPSQNRVVTGANGFNSITCLTNEFVHDRALLGCGPSAFIGLLRREFSDGGTFAGLNNRNVSEDDFRRWLVAPTGIHGRPRIAEYMGTCVAGLHFEGLTTLGNFLAGANNFLRDSGSPRRLRASAGLGQNYNTTANMITRNIGNVHGIGYRPVVAAYWLGAVSAHFAPISHYDITWGAGITINVQTIDHPGQWYALSGNWSGQTGVYYLE